MKRPTHFCTDRRERELAGAKLPETRADRTVCAVMKSLMGDDKNMSAPDVR